jgi:superoxide dismutase
MSFTLPELPYHRDNFGKVLSAETFEYHYGKHHQTYVTNLNSLVKGTEWEQKSLDDIVAQYLSLHSAARTARSSTTVPSTGTTPSTGTASPLKRQSSMENSKN